MSEPDSDSESLRENLKVRDEVEPLKLEPVPLADRQVALPIQVIMVKPEVVLGSGALPVLLPDGRPM